MLGGRAAIARADVGHEAQVEFAAFLLERELRTNRRVDQQRDGQRGNARRGDDAEEVRRVTDVTYLGSVSGNAGRPSTDETT